MTRPPTYPTPGEGVPTLPSIGDDRLPPRFWSKVRVDEASGCWIWTASKNRQGYGKYRNGGSSSLPAHRVAYEILVGPLGELLACHRCDTPPCVNPAHIFGGTCADNHADRNAKGRQASGDRNGQRLHPESVPRGERNGRARLQPGDVVIIRAELAAGTTKASLARRFRVSETVIRHVGQRKSWRHIVASEVPA